jgi:hypothetical protein
MAREFERGFRCRAPWGKAPTMPRGVPQLPDGKCLNISPNVMCSRALERRLLIRDSLWASGRTSLANVRGMR